MSCIRFSGEWSPKIRPLGNCLKLSTRSCRLHLKEARCADWLGDNLTLPTSQRSLIMNNHHYGLSRSAPGDSSHLHRNGWKCTQAPGLDEGKAPRQTPSWGHRAPPVTAPGPRGSRVNPEAHCDPFAPAGTPVVALWAQCALPGLSCQYFIFHKAKRMHLSSS